MTRSGKLGFEAQTFYTLWFTGCGVLKGEEIPRLWRGGSSSLTFTGVVPGLCFSHLPLEIGPQHEFEAPSLRDSGGILADPSPPLKRWANHHCAYGAGEFALAALLLQQCTHAGPFEGPQTIRPSALPGGIYTCCVKTWGFQQPVKLCLVQCGDGGRLCSESAPAGAGVAS